MISMGYVVVVAIWRHYWCDRFCWDCCQLGDGVEMFARVIDLHLALLDQQPAQLGEAEQRLGRGRLLARRRGGLCRAPQSSRDFLDGYGVLVGMFSL